MLLKTLFEELRDFLDKHTSELAYNSDIFNRETHESVIKFDAGDKNEKKALIFIEHVYNNAFFYQLSEYEISELKKLTLN